MAKFTLVVLLAVIVLVLARIARSKHRTLRRSRAHILKRMRDEG